MSVKKRTSATKKKATAKAKKTTTTAAKRAAPVRTAFTRSALLDRIATNTGLTKKQVANVLDELSGTVESHIKKGGVGIFTLPGLLKIKVVRKPATRARKGINPFTGEETIFKAKPARNVVKVQALKKLKDMVA